MPIIQPSMNYGSEVVFLLGGNEAISQVNPIGSELISRLGRRRPKSAQQAVTGRDTDTTHRWIDSSVNWKSSISWLISY